MLPRGTKRGRAVLWGARRRDWQIGGEYDRRLQRHRGEWVMLATSCGRAVLGAGITTEQALRAMLAFARALR